MKTKYIYKLLDSPFPYVLLYVPNKVFEYIFLFVRNLVDFFSTVMQNLCTLETFAF